MTLSESQMIKKRLNIATPQRPPFFTSSAHSKTQVPSTILNKNMMKSSRFTQVDRNFSISIQLQLALTEPIVKLAILNKHKPRELWRNQSTELARLKGNATQSTRQTARLDQQFKMKNEIKRWTYSKRYSIQDKSPLIALVVMSLRWPPLTSAQCPAPDWWKSNVERCVGADCSAGRVSDTAGQSARRLYSGVAWVAGRRRRRATPSPPLPLAFCLFFAEFISHAVRILIILDSPIYNKKQ